MSTLAVRMFSANIDKNLEPLTSYETLFSQFSSTYTFIFAKLRGIESSPDMAPQTSIPVAANVLGTIGTVFWCIQLVPQIWYNWKQKRTDGLPGLMMFLWATCTLPNGS